MLTAAPLPTDEGARGPRRRLRFECARCREATEAPPRTQRAQERLCRDCFGKRPDTRARQLNELEGREWAQASRSVQQYPDVRSVKQRLHGASFPLSLARQQIEIYTRSRDLVLDPFVGVGTTLDAAASLQRRGVGIELNPEFAALAEADLRELPPGVASQEVILGDARQLSAYLPASSVDFLLTSPPYGSLLKTVKGAFAYKWQEHSKINVIPNPTPYSDAVGDLGNMEYGEYLDALTACLAQSRVVLKPNAYAVWVLKDFRALGQGVPYVNLHGHFIERAEACGFQLWDMRIYDQTRYRPLVCLGYPSRNFYLNIGHSYLVILRNREP